MECPCDAVLVAHFSPECQRLFSKPTCRSIVPSTPGYPPQTMEGARDPCCVSKPSGQCQAFLKQYLCLILVAHVNCHITSSVKGLRAHRWRNSLASYQRLLQEPPPFTVMTTHIPELLQ